MLYHTDRYTSRVASLVDGSSPVELRLVAQRIGFAGSVIHQDGTAEPLELEALTELGAKREATDRLCEMGYTPAARWADGDVRVFRHE